MKVAGGVVALIAGIFGCIAAVVTLFFGGVGAAFSASGANTVIGLKTYNKTAKVILVTYSVLFALYLIANLAGCSANSPVGDYGAKDQSGVAEISKDERGLVLDAATDTNGLTAMKGVLTPLPGTNLYQVTDTDNHCVAEVALSSDFSQVTITNDNNQCGTFQAEGHVNGVYNRITSSEETSIVKKWMGGNSTAKKADQPAGPTSAQVIAAEEAANGVQPAVDSSVNTAASQEQQNAANQLQADAAAAEAYASAHGQPILQEAALAGGWMTSDGNSSIKISVDGNVVNLHIVSTSSNGNIGELKGTMTPINPFFYHATDNAGNCYAEVAVQGQSLVVMGDSGGCDGANVTLNGKYSRLAPATTQAKAQTPSWNDVYKKAQAANNAETMARLGVGSAQSVLATQQAAVNAAVALTSQCPNATAACENGIHVIAMEMGDQVTDGKITHTTTQFSNAPGTKVYMVAALKTDLPYNEPVDVKIFQKEYGAWTSVHEDTRPIKSLIGTQTVGYWMILKGGENAKYRIALSMNGIALGQQDFVIGQPPADPSPYAKPRLQPILPHPYAH